jgi:AcrR family transcriptional regulator
MTRKKRHVARSPEDLAKKRDAILDAALRSLLEKGYTKTTMTDVAREAGIGRGTVYWHFESKDDLFFSLLEREFAALEGDAAPVLEQGMTPADMVASFVRAFFEVYSEAPNLLRAFLSVFTGAHEAMRQRLLAFFAATYGRYNRLFADLLEAGKSDGSVRTDLDSDVVAASIVVLLDALYLQVAFGLIDNDPKRLADAVLDLVNRGILSPDKDSES